MTTAMRIVLISSLVLGALGLHFTLCEWHADRALGLPSTRVAGWGTERFYNVGNTQCATHGGFQLQATARRALRRRHPAAVRPRHPYW